MCIEIIERRIRGSNEVAYLTAGYKTTFSSAEDSTPRQAVNSRVPRRHPRRNRRASKQRLRVRRPQLDVISAQRHQVVILSSDFELDPA